MPNGKLRSGTSEFAPDVREKTRGAQPGMVEPAAVTPEPPAELAKESSAKDQSPDPLLSTMWPWALMQQIQTQMQRPTEQQPHAAPSKPLEKSA